MSDEQEVAKQEIEDGGEEFPLKCGVTLTLRPAGMPAIRKLIEQAGGWSLLKNPEKLAALSKRKQVIYGEASNKLFLYVAGWGVETNPPSEAVEELETLGWTAKSKKLIRARWIRYLLADEDEIGELLGRIMFLSMRR